MVTRQDGERIVHFDPGTGVVCRMRILGVVGIDRPRETTCQHCMNTPVWKQAWKAEAKRVKAP